MVSNLIVTLVAAASAALLLALALAAALHHTARVSETKMICPRLPKRAHLHGIDASDSTHRPLAGWRPGNACSIRHCGCVGKYRPAKDVVVGALHLTLCML